MAKWIDEWNEMISKLNASAFETGNLGDEAKEKFMSHQLWVIQGWVESRNELEKVKLGEFNALQHGFKSLNKYERPKNTQMQDTESKKEAIKYDMRILNRWVADQYAKLLSYKVESMDIPTRDFTGMTHTVHGYLTDIFLLRFEVGDESR